MQHAVSELSALGALPCSDEATVEFLQSFEALLEKVRVPISDDDACALVQLLCPDGDSCFGLAWTLVHLIETAPGWPIKEALNGLDGEWIDRLRLRGY